MHLDRELLDGFALRAGEAPHLRRGEFDVCFHRIGHELRAPLDLLGRDDDLAVPFVELRCVLAHGRLAPAPDLREHRGGDRLRITRFPASGVSRAFRERGLHCFV